MGDSKVAKTRRRPVKARVEGVGAPADSSPSQDGVKWPSISASSREAFKRCRYQWSFRYIDKLEPKVTATPLRFGTLIHTSMEYYYVRGVKRGIHPAITFQQQYAKELETAHKMGFRDEDGTWHDAAALGVDMLEHYVDHYGKDDEWKVIATEVVFRQPVYHPITGKQIGEYVGVLDTLMEHRPTGHIWIRDYKSAKTIDTSYLAMDDQSSGYWTFGVDWLRSKGVLKPGKDLQGIQFDFLRKSVRDEREQNEKGQYLNKDGSVSQKQPPDFFKRHISYRGENERRLTRERVAAELEEMQWVREGRLSMLKSPSKMNCKFCDVSDICELHEVGADWREMTRLIMMPRREFQRVAVEWEHDH